jgi:hypothetical protein
MLKTVVSALLALGCLSCGGGPQLRVLPLPEDRRAAEALEAGQVAVEGDNVRLLKPPSAAGLEPPAEAGVALDRRELSRATELFFKGDLEGARGPLDRLRQTLVANPARLPRDEQAREDLYAALLLLYRIAWMQGGPDEELANWLALYLPDQEPSVAQVPPEMEARLAHARGAQQGARPLRIRLDPGGPECSVYSDGLLLGGGSNMVHNLTPTAHWLQVDCEGRSLPLLHRVTSDGELKLRPQLEAQLTTCGGALCLSPHPDPEVARANAAIAAAAAGAQGTLSLDAQGATYTPVSGTWSRRLPLRDGRINLDAVPPARHARNWLALSSLLGSAAALGAGVYFNREYNDLMVQTNRGWQDRRAEADQALALSAVGYGLSALLLSSAGLLYLWPDPEEAPADGTWWPVGR